MRIIGEIAALSALSALSATRHTLFVAGMIASRSLAAFLASFRRLVPGIGTVAGIVFSGIGHFHSPIAVRWAKVEGKFQCLNSSVQDSLGEPVQFKVVKPVFTGKILCIRRKASISGLVIAPDLVFLSVTEAH
ncbi:hypothetical protein D3C72_1755290 [compost metagenome]